MMRRFALFGATVLFPCALLVAFGRYFAGAPQSGLRFPTPLRAHLAILGGLYLLSVAFGDNLLSLSGHY